jgi:hypothetical protein
MVKKLEKSSTQEELFNLFQDKNEEEKEREESEIYA